MSDQPDLTLETDPRFPSGPWVGFFLQRELPGRHLMELRLTFKDGRMTGEGRDRVAEFVITGHYSVADGKCRWTKRYVGRHDVSYTGYNEGKGIWGTWQFLPKDSLHVHPTGGFHIWPEGMGDPTGESLSEEADLPAPAEELIGVGN